MKERVEISFTYQIDSVTIDVSKWSDENYSYIADELYCALGQEHIVSKYFHLYSIIEYCEIHYSAHDESIKMFTDEERNNIQDFFTNSINDGDKKFKRINQPLTEATNIGREQKQLNILKWMGINTYQFDGSQITKKHLERLRRLRGKLYHGNREDDQSLKECLQELFDIDIQIVRFISSHIEQGGKDISDATGEDVLDSCVLTDSFVPIVPQRSIFESDNE